MAGMPKATGGDRAGKARLGGSRRDPPNPTPTLDEEGIDKHTADRARKVHALSPKDMAAYARQAKDSQLIEWATEIKVRAERKAGGMLREMTVNGGRAGRGSRAIKAKSTTLVDLEVSANQSSRWQKLAAVPEDQFERAVTAAKEAAGEVTTAAMLRMASPHVAISSR